MAEPEPRRSGLTRVPPHDLDLERKILAPALLWPTAAGVIAELDPFAFYKPAHQLIATTIAELHSEGSSTDAGTVAAVLRHQGQLDNIGGAIYLVDLQADAIGTTINPLWLDLLHDYSQRRRTLNLAHEIVESVYRNIPADGLVAELHDAANARHLEQRSTWEPINLARTLAGEGDSIEPTVLARSDQARILYPGKVHSLIGEPESGKSWLALLACVQTIAEGGHVLYVDFEADDVTQTTRLLELGANPADILDRFHYIRPDEPHDKAAALRLTTVLDAWQPALVVVDGVAEALSLNGWDENKASDVTAFYVQIARPLARCGAAVVTIDHVVKDKESQGRYARGSTAKLAAIDGAVYKLETVKPFGRGLHGQAKVVVNKDRHGHVRATSAGGKLLGHLHLDSTQQGRLTIGLTPPETTQSDGPFRPTHLMEKVSRELEASTDPLSLNQIRRIVQGKGTVVDQATRVLVAEGYVTTVKGTRNSVLHVSTKPFREPAERDFPLDRRAGE